MLADDKYSELAFKFMDAYENMDPETMVEMTKDTVKFHPGDISGVFDVDKQPNADFIVERQSNWDSISRNYAFILPLKLEDTNYTVVETSFRIDILRMVQQNLQIFMKDFILMMRIK